MIRLGLLSAASAIMLSLAGPSTAAQIEWTFTDAAFTGGGTLTGSFVWDTDTSQVQSYDFLTTAGSLVGAVYDSAQLFDVGVDAGFIDFYPVGYAGKVRLLVTTVSLSTVSTNLGLSSSLNGFYECYLSNVCNPYRQSDGNGYLAGRELLDEPPETSEVPLPATGILLAAGLGAIGFFRRRKT